MSEKHKKHHDEAELLDLQLALVRMQVAAIASGERIQLLLEGRDAAGKDGTIKRLTEHLSPRATRVVALPKPSDRERTQWYFQRYVEHLPAAGEFVIFNRSWYNRAGVEVVNGFSTAPSRRRSCAMRPSSSGCSSNRGSSWSRSGSTFRATNRSVGWIRGAKTRSSSSRSALSTRSRRKNGTITRRRAT